MSLQSGARIEGIDAPLPPGEHVRWQGRPAWRPLAWRAFHGRTVVAYFALLALWQGAAAATGNRPVAAAAGTIVFLAVLALVSLGCSALLAWLTARNSVYAITDRRVVMRIGAIVPSIINIPFRMIEAVAVKRFANGTGDLAIALAGSDRIAFFQLWPHVRPWYVNHPQPMLRAVADPLAVGAALQAAVAEATGAGSVIAPGAPVAPAVPATAGAHHPTRPAAVAL